MNPPCFLFLLCENEAEGAVDTGLFVLGTNGWLPACKRCADTLDYTLVEAEFIEENPEP